MEGAQGKPHARHRQGGHDESQPALVAVRERKTRQADRQELIEPGDNGDDEADPGAAVQGGEPDGDEEHVGPVR